MLKHFAKPPAKNEFRSSSVLNIFVYSSATYIVRNKLVWIFTFFFVKFSCILFLRHDKSCLFSFVFKRMTLINFWNWLLQFFTNVSNETTNDSKMSRNTIISLKCSTIRRFILYWAYTNQHNKLNFQLFVTEI